MGKSGRAAIVDTNAAIRIADFLYQRLRMMKPGDRIRADLTVSNEAKKPLTIASGTQLEEIDVADGYSAAYEWLDQFCEFARTSGGFEVV